MTCCEDLLQEINKKYFKPISFLIHLGRGRREMAFLCFAKNSKIQNGRHFWRDKFFYKNGITTPQRYPVGQKFRRNRSI